MRRNLLFAVVALVCVTACYRVTVQTGAPPAPKTIDKPWQMSLVFGLVPPPEINSKETCPQGVSTVVTERSFLNALVGGLSFNLITPMHAQVTCAAGPVAKH